MPMPFDFTASEPVDGELCKKRGGGIAADENDRDVINARQKSAFNFSAVANLPFQLSDKCKSKNSKRFPKVH